MLISINYLGNTTKQTCMSCLPSILF